MKKVDISFKKRDQEKRRCFPPKNSNVNTYGNTYYVLRYVVKRVCVCVYCHCSDTTKLEMAKQTLSKENRELKKESVSLVEGNTVLQSIVPVCYYFIYICATPCWCNSFFFKCLYFHINIIFIYCAPSK